MSSSFGSFLRISLFGQSHGDGIGLIMDGFPAGMVLDLDAISREMGRRRPGKSNLTTGRSETDHVEFVSGVLHGVTTGQPILLLIRNHDMHSADYGATLDKLRPSHADYTGHVRFFGFEDFRGGGSFSGRLTAPLVAAGEMCRQWLSRYGIRFENHISRIGSVCDLSMDSRAKDENLSFLRDMDLPVLDPDAIDRMKQEIVSARERGDSVGGEIEGRITGLPPGLGAPFFDSMESVLSHLFFSIPAVKGVSFGSGFDLAGMNGSQANDAFRLEDGRIVTQTNHAGGINGGITNGMPVLYRCAFRPTPSIAMTQDTVSLQDQCNAPVTIHGRHDPCIVPRAVPVMDAIAAIGIMEMWKERQACLH